jgi:hypothetical protein
MRIPANTIEIKYTSGDEFIYEFSYKFYQGYYYEFNDKFFAGKEFDINAPELIRSKGREVNTALTNSKTFVYGSLSKIKPNNKKPASFIYKNESDVRYFIYNIGTNVIREISKKTYDEFKDSPFYTSVVLNYKGGFNNIELDEAEKKIPGIKTFINTSYVPPQAEESGLVG